MRPIYPEYVINPAEVSGTRINDEGLFRDLSSRTRKALRMIRLIREIKAGELLVEKGHIPSSVSILCEGRAVLVSDTQNSENVLVRYADPHEVFGITEMFAEVGYTYSVRAVSTCQVERIERDDFDKFLRNEEVPRSRLIRILGIGLQLRQRRARDQ